MLHCKKNTCGLNKHHSVRFTMTPTHDLKALRLSKGLRQDDIGNRKDVVDVEKGRKMPGQRLIRRMATALKVPTEVVFAACQESVRRAAAAIAPEPDPAPAPTPPINSGV
jgi:transcriptional regulator with XRE-family HTH domain